MKFRFTIAAPPDSAETIAARSRRRSELVAHPCPLPMTIAGFRSLHDALPVIVDRSRLGLVTEIRDHGSLIWTCLGNGESYEWVREALGQCIVAAAFDSPGSQRPPKPAKEDPECR